MRARSFMVIAGEASGDLLAAELVQAIRAEFAGTEPALSAECQPLYTSLEPRFFGAGGQRMAAAGVDLAFDMTEHSVVGFSDVLQHYFQFRRWFAQLRKLALERQPDVIVCVDFSGFNRRFVHAIRNHVRSHQDWFHDWNPKLIQYVSPQVWASRAGRARQMERDHDLLLSIFPFEKDWYAKRTPRLRVEFVGHPMLDRYANDSRVASSSPTPRPSSSPLALLLPGSRGGELARHLPVMLGALEKVRAGIPDLRALMVLPNDGLAEQAKTYGPPASLAVRVGGLPAALAEADVAIASTGTVTMECAYFGVPTVALYKTSWSTFQIGKRIVKVKWLAMPNLLANEEIFPEFIQDAATPDDLGRAALDLLRDEARRNHVKRKLSEIIASLGGPGAVRRAARTIAELSANGVPS